MKKAEQYLNDCPSGATTKGLFKGSEVIEAINKSRKDLIDEILRMREPVKWHEDGKERIKPVDIFKLKDQIE